MFIINFSLRSASRLQIRLVRSAPQLPLFFSVSVSLLKRRPGYAEFLIFTRFPLPTTLRTIRRLNDDLAGFPAAFRAIRRIQHFRRVGSETSNMSAKDQWERSLLNVMFSQSESKETSSRCALTFSDLAAVGVSRGHILRLHQKSEFGRNQSLSSVGLWTAPWKWSRFPSNRRF